MLQLAAAAAAAGVNSCATQLEHEVHQLARRLAATGWQQEAGRARPQMAASKSVIILVLAAAAVAFVIVVVVPLRVCLPARMNIAQVGCAAPKLFGFGLANSHTHTHIHS